jgi:small-conductance mechanosensitive channel
MSLFEIEVLKALISIVVLLVLRFLIHKSLKRIKESYSLQKHRVVVVTKLMDAILILIGLIFVFLVFGVKKDQVVLFASSILAFLGIAFFAQWSILSNITSGIILFINYPARIGDEIHVMDKEIPIEGNIRNIGVLFMTIRTEDGSIVSLPNNVVMQKPIKVIPRKNK